MTSKAVLAAALGIIVLVGTPRAQAPRSGLDVAEFDRTVLPQDDLYRHVNAGWLRRTDIPSDRVTYGVFAELTEKTERDLHVIVEDLLAKPQHARGSTAQQIADLYRSTVDIERIEALGASPLEPQLRRIEAAASARDIAAEAGHLAAIAAGGPFGGTMGLDPLNLGAAVVRVTQGGVLLPDRDYYLSDEAGLTAIRQEYVRYLARIFRLVGRATPDEDARAVLAFETALAKIHWTEAESRNISNTYLRFTLKQLMSEMPGFDWYAWARPQGIDRSPAVILAQPSFFKAFAALIPTVPLSTLKAWLVSRFVTAAAPYLSSSFDMARYDFFGVTLTGQRAPRERWKRGVSMVSVFVGDALGRLYVEKHFPPASRTRVQGLVVNVVAAFRDALREAEWLGPQARREALDKLSALSTGIGYPARWRDYRTLAIRPDDLYGNWQRGLAFDNQYLLGNVAGSAGGEWPLTPQTVNASYAPATNQIVLPAAIFQPPLFDVNADDAVNYGAAGALIGHELGHAFDDRGRRYDGAGAVRDWWTPTDAARFAERNARLVAQLDGYEALPGVQVDGSLTAGETSGDIGGLAVAFRAYRKSLKGATPPVIDGLTGDQRFFMAWARMWRSKERDEYIRSTVHVNPYLPSALRANAAVSNVDAFFDAFNVQPSHRLYRPPAQRLRIW
jgi:predicted metalloendopeptidase